MKTFSRKNFGDIEPFRVRYLYRPLVASLLEVISRFARNKLNLKRGILF